MRKPLLGALAFASLSITACDWLTSSAPHTDAGGAPSLSEFGPNPVASGQSVTLTLYGHGFGSGLRVFLRNHTQSREVNPADVRVIDSTHARATVTFGAKAASWYIAVADVTGPHSPELPFRVIGDDYPDSVKSKACNYSASDQFGFVPRNCTSFVAWRLSEDGATFANAAGASYVCSDGRTLTTWSHARCWDEAARARGYVVDHTPRVGSIAQWNSVGTTVNGAPVGHVAYIAAVYLETQEVLIEEYNFDVTCAYSTRRVPIAQVENVLHIHDLLNYETARLKNDATDSRAVF